MNKLFAPIIATLIVASYAFMFHGVHISPHDWQSVVMWLPVYVSPIWVISGASYLSERGKE